MLNNSVETQLKKLDARVTHLEKKQVPLFSLSFLKNWRTVGWFVLTLFALILLREWWLGVEYSAIVGVGLLIGLLLIVQSNSWFGLSDSTKILLDEYKGSKHRGAHIVHKKPGIRTKESAETLNIGTALLTSAGLFLLAIALSWGIFTYIQDSGLQLLALLVIPTLGMVYALWKNSTILVPLNAGIICLLLLMAQAPLVVLTYLIIFSLTLTLWAARTKHWLLQAIITLGSFFILGSVALNNSAAPGIEVAVLVTSLLFILGLSLPFVFHRREVGERRLVRVTLFSIAVYSAILPLLLSSYLSEKSWGLALILLAFIFSSFYAVSLARFGRFSYAKYYGLALVVLLMLSSTILGTVAIATLSWLIISILLLTIGFSGKSYTARMAGLVTLLLSFVLYAVTIFPFNTLIIGPVILEERVWIGVLLAAFMVVLGLWYKEYPIKGQELEQRPIILEFLYTGSLAIIGGLIWVTMVPPYQSIAWIIGGVVFIWWGIRQRSVLVQSAAVALTVVSISKLFLVDSLTYSLSQRIDLVVIAGLLLIAGGYVLTLVSRK